jgi:uncharacterized phiE125 gp8 family phage protein
MYSTIETPPVSTAYPDSLTVTKTRLRVEHTTDDDYIKSLLRSAAEQVSIRTGRQVLECTRLLGLRSWWVGALELPYPKLQSVSSVKYYDTDDTLQTMDPADYVVTTAGTHGALCLKSSYPALSHNIGHPVQVTYVCGYGDEADGSAVPEGLRHAIRELVAVWYEEKDATRFPSHVDALLDVYKLGKDWPECL